MGRRFRQGILLFFSLFLLGCAHVSSDKVQTPVESKSPYLDLMLARYEENQGNWDRALMLYAKVNDPFALLAQARISFILNQQDNALHFVDSVIESGRYVDEALDLRTKIYARKGDWDQAIRDTHILSARYPDNAQLKLFLANLKIVVSDFKGAKTILNSLLGSGDDRMILFALSKACMGSKDYPCARDALSRLIREDPKFIPAYLVLGKIHEMAEEIEKAESTYKKCLEIEPYSAEALMALTDLYISEKRYREAIDQMKKLKQLNDDVRIIRKLVLLELQEERYEDALSNLAEIKEMTIDDSYYLAITFAKLDRLEDALETLSEIPTAGRLGCETAMLRSSILKDLDRQEEVINELLSAWEYFSPKSSCIDIGYQLATELDTAGRRDEGLEVAHKILEGNPHDPVALNLIGYVWADQGINLDKAHAMIKEALKARPGDPYILDSMAWVLYRQGKLGEALKHLKKAVEMLDRDPTIHEHMGDILRDMGDRRKALDYYLKSSTLSVKPRDELKEKINELLKQLRVGIYE